MSRRTRPRPAVRRASRMSRAGRWFGRFAALLLVAALVVGLGTVASGTGNDAPVDAAPSVEEHVGLLWEQLESLAAGTTDPAVPDAAADGQGARGSAAEDDAGATLAPAGWSAAELASARAVLARHVELLLPGYRAAREAAAEDAEQDAPASRPGSTGPRTSAAYATPAAGSPPAGGVGGQDGPDGSPPEPPDAAGFALELAASSDRLADLAVASSGDSARSLLTAAIEQGLLARRLAGDAELAEPVLAGDAYRTTPGGALPGARCTAEPAGDAGAAAGPDEAALSHLAAADAAYRLAYAYAYTADRSTTVDRARWRADAAEYAELGRRIESALPGDCPAQRRPAYAVPAAGAGAGMLSSASLELAAALRDASSHAPDGWRAALAHEAWSAAAAGAALAGDDAVVLLP
ncbi:hypothetical protein ACQ3I4_12340 [Zafaria sp. Z1313]|uniref:hypothetical protein n=1 Tax=unclassified Zafaria TaxID=2828765 RepID=UPI002E767C35|nr:hypothetical protein [Zafaria sp. J156]MEE1621935.1 hypothetical protein [Zafaria sp. J156]